MDAIGPLPPHSEGDIYIIVIIECLTRWVELYQPKARPLSQQLARALLQHSGRYGQASRCIALLAYTSDNGPQYVNATITELLRLLGTEHVRTIAHSHEENLIVERVNKEVMRHLRALVFDDKTFANWSLKLPLVQRILNSSEHESIGVSPAQLLLGNAISLDKEVFYQSRH